MGKAAIDFASGQASSAEPLGGAIPRSINVLVDAGGAIHVRPGISAWGDWDPTAAYDEDTSVDGISVWNGYPVYVTSDRKLHAQITKGVGSDLSDDTAATKLDGDKRPVLVPSRNRIVIAGGALLQKWEGPAEGLAGRLGGPPPAATHVVSNAQRLIVNPNGSSGQIQWSDEGLEETWSGEFKELESRPDPLVALHDNTGELIGFGTTTVQVLDPDATETYISTRTWSTGMGAPYSFAQADEQFGFLDAKRRIQLSNGREYQPISDPALTEPLRRLATIEDCWGFRMPIGSWDLMGFHFPSAARTFVFNLGSKKWVEWSGFSAGQWTAWMPRCHFHWEDENLHLIGLSDGTIGQMDTSVTTDMGQPIVAEVVSGFSNDGTDNWKQHQWTKFTFRRGLGAPGRSPAPKCQLYWRDGTGAWEGPEELDLGNADDKDPVVVARTLGMYQTRQWRLRMSDNVPLTLVSAVTTFEEGEQ